jgi:tRNA pseudouridine13 synthase
LAVALRLMPGHCRTERDLLQRLIQRPDAWEKAFNAVNPRLKRLYLSAFQSSLFDSVVEMRLPLLGQLQQGDIAFKHENGACFVVDAAAQEQPRADAFEISPTGPMFGRKMKQPQGAVWEMERQVLAGAGVRMECLESAGPLHLDGERRPLRVPLVNASFDIEGDTLLLEFSLPKGSYATAVVREFTKNS